MRICRRIEKRLWELQDGAVPQAEQERILLHLERCAHCQAALRKIETLHNSLTCLSKKSTPLPSLNTDSIFENALALSTHHVNRPRLVIRRASWALCILLVMAAGVSLSKRKNLPLANAPKQVVAQISPAPKPFHSPQRDVKPPIEIPTIKQDALPNLTLKNTHTLVPKTQLAKSSPASPTAETRPALATTKTEPQPLSYIRVRVYEDQPGGETRWNELSVIEQGDKRLVTNTTSYDSKSNSKMVCVAQAPNVRVIP